MIAKAHLPDDPELHLMLKSLLMKVVIDWQNDRLRFVWKHGVDLHKSGYATAEEVGK